MKTYTNEERFAALNRHRDTLSLDKHQGFTVITQHVTCNSVEEFADYIITMESFLNEYGYPIQTLNFLFDYSTLYSRRKEVWFNEGRTLNIEESNDCLKCDEEYEIKIKNLKGE